MEKGGKEVERLTVKHNSSDISSIADFVNISGRLSGGAKNVCFVRLIGSTPSLIKDTATMDKILGERMQRGKALYKHIQGLPNYFTPDEVSFYTSAYGDWVKSGRSTVRVKSCDDSMSSALGGACGECVRILKMHKPQFSEAMERSFVVKLLSWFDFLMKDLPFKFSDKRVFKVVGENITKEQEYLFFYLLTLVRCDVLLLQRKADLEKNAESLNLSKAVAVGAFERTDLKHIVAAQGIAAGGSPTENAVRSGSVPTVTIPNRPQRRHTQPVAIERQSSAVLQPMVPTVPRTSNTLPVGFGTPTPRPQRKEKSYEELATLASSIVLIAILDKKGEIKGSGSGIMIGTGGYILTNCHVAAAGAAYAVHIEGEEKPHFTDEMIKYHKNLDLALIRIDRSLTPLPIYNGSKKLVRGQRVVAIGSPLGLFNSVSDGIISGFRKIRDVDMIQFTAPISNGSSGGAVLNMYGEVVGISTAGIDAGQNLNLAVSYEDIIPFVRGFVG